MNPRKFGLRGIFLAIAATFFVTSCQRPIQRAELVFINGVEPETLDPALITGQPEGRIANALFEGLTRFDRQGRVQPGVATHWEISPDGKTYTFHLNPEAKWSNGEPVTAQDFVQSWERTLRPATGSEYSYQLFPIAGAHNYNAGETTDFATVAVRALDERTLRVTLEYPASYFLDLCAFITLKPVHLPSLQRHGEEWFKPGNLIGNGAYRLQSWRLHDRIRLEKNPHYWNRAQVALETIDILPIGNPNTAINFFLTGEADLIMDKGMIPSSLADALREKPYFHAAPFLGTYFTRINVTRPPFDDPRVRLALAHAIDRRRITEKITRMGEVIATSLVPPGTAGYQPPPGIEYNPDKAKKLLAQAGYPNGKGFPLVRYLYNAKPLETSIAIEIQDMLETNLGIQLSLQKQEWKVYLQSMSRLDYDLCRSSWVGDYHDPNTFLDMFVTGGGNNRTGWSNPTYDQLIDQAARQLEPEQRWETFSQAEAILISQEAPILPIYHYVGVQFYDPEIIGGIAPNVLDEHPLAEMFRR